MIKSVFIFISIWTQFYALNLQDLIFMQKKLNEAETWTLFKRHYYPPKFLIPIIIDIENPLYPELQTELFQVDENNRERCIISYASRNLNYPGSLLMISECLKKINFSGHFLYRIGGWPNMEEDGFDLIDVPYAFKIKAFQEAKRLGYKNILWLDSSMRPTKSLDFIFEKIEKEGFFFNLNTYFSSRINSIPNSALISLNSSKEEIKKIRYVNTGVIGFNFQYVLAGNFFDEFYFLAQKKISFFNGFFEELPFSVLIKKYDLEHLEYKNSYPLFQYIDLKECFYLQKILDYRAVFAIDYTYSKKWHPEF